MYAIIIVMVNDFTKIRLTAPPISLLNNFLRQFSLILLLITLCPMARAQKADDPNGVGATSTTLQFRLIDAPAAPVIDAASPDARGNKFGFEGGTVVKVAGVYHMFVSEMAGDPKSVAMKLAHWTSPDATHWKRVATLYETDGRDVGERSALWAPMPVYNLKDERWNLFYVAYQARFESCEGKIWRAVSAVKGPDGIGGPYVDEGIILQRDKNPPAWEGFQGTDSFYPFRVGNRWYGFYGSHVNDPFWQVGLVEAPHLDGPWTRLPDGNPLTFEPTFAENPIVTQVGNLLVAVYDSDTYSPAGTPTGGYSNSESYHVGYTWSTDGIHWAKGGRITVQQDGKSHWASDIRTPLCLIPEGDDTFTILYTAQVKDTNYWAVGRATVKLVRNP